MAKGGGPVTWRESTRTFTVWGIQSQAFCCLKDSSLSELIWEREKYHPGHPKAKNMELSFGCLLPAVLFLSAKGRRWGHPSAASQKGLDRPLGREQGGVLVLAPVGWGLCPPAGGSSWACGASQSRCLSRCLQLLLSFLQTSENSSRPGQL